MASGLSKATHLSYSSGQRCFIDFCLQFGLSNPDNSILPASDMTILSFISYLSLSYQPSMVKSYLSAVRSLHVMLGLDNPFVNNPRIQLVLRGIKRLQGNNRRLRRPITPELLLLFRDKLDLSSYEHSLYWAAFCIAFFGFLRAGELSITPTASRSDCLQLSDLSISCFPFPHLVRLLIKVSKSDPFRDTCPVVVGRNNSALCPVEALLKYLHFRGGSPGPPFIFPDGSPLTRDLLNSKIRNLLVSCGVVGDYMGHSFRIGAATTAARVGLPDHLIKTLGRWSSDAYKLYIRTSELDIAAVSSKLLN